jgi:hypothetical protein
MFWRIKAVKTKTKHRDIKRVLLRAPAIAEFMGYNISFSMMVNNIPLEDTTKSKCPSA